MNTKIIPFLFGAFLFTTTARAQAVINPAIQEKLNTFITLSNEKQWDKAFDLLYPKMFNQVSKEELVNVMTGMESDGMSLHMSNVRITSTSVPVEEGDETFVRVEYAADLTVKILKEGMFDSPKATQAIDEQFRAVYGQHKVNWDNTKSEFNIIAEKSMMAIQSKDGVWSLVEINMDQPQLMEALFSPSIMNALVRIQ